MAEINNTFEDALEQFDLLAEIQPVDKTVFWSILTSLESHGLEAVGQGRVKLERLAQALHGVFTKITDIQIEPPLDDVESNTIARKVETYAKMAEQTTPKKTRGKAKSPTNPKGIATDKAKR